MSVAMSCYYQNERSALELDTVKSKSTLSNVRKRFNKRGG